MDRELKDVVPCCHRTFHHSCLGDVTVCPYSKGPWESIPCTVCQRPLHSPFDCCIYTSLERQNVHEWNAAVLTCIATAATRLGKNALGVVKISCKLRIKNYQLHSLDAHI